MHLVRSTLLAAALVGLATAANAASIALSTDKASYLPGETLTLTLTGDGEGELLFDMFVQVSYDDSLVTPTGVQSQEVVMDMEESLDSANSPGWETLLSQTQIIAPTDVGIVTATAQFTVGALFGIATFTTGVGPGAGSQPFSFGSTAPGSSVSLVVPEPTVGVLLALGLFGLGLGARRRSR